jgi:hypothetical protein
MLAQMMDASQFKREEDFKDWFLTEPDARQQILGLNAWRRHQQQVVGSLANLVKLLASDQYTHSDHFLLELLQNADDNDYAAGVTPSLAITLSETACTFECNEKGFSAENVFAICYAAASTKKRQKSARTFIGEKGIGFKSIFAVAEAVEVHSGDYHFELRDTEYVLPHLLEGERTTGSRIVVRFKKSLDGMGQSVSGRLRLLSEESRHFLLFLQQLERLTFHDEIVGTNRSVQVVRDRKTKRCLVEADGNAVEYHVEAFPIKVPDHVVRSRFDDLREDLDREILFAVPLPADLEQNNRASGTLFCYLPTQQKTGLPIHIQVDAKTVTSREDIVDAQTSEWNRFMLNQVELKLVELFQQLRGLSDFAQHLPLYLPSDPSNPGTGNRDLAESLKRFCNLMKKEAFVRDRHGDFRPAGNVFDAPEVLQSWIETDQYEKHLAGVGGQKPGDTESDRTFLDPSWRKHSKILENFGTRLLQPNDLRTMWKLGGAPGILGTADDKVRREFLSALMEYVGTGEDLLLRDCPIYPLRASERSYWGAIEQDVMLVVSEVQNPTIPEDVTIIEPSLTMVPSSSSRQADEIRDFNNRFRDFITLTLKVQRFSDADYLEKIVVHRMKAPFVGVWDRSKLLELSLRWVELYYRIWRRQKTIEDDSKKQWQQLISAIRECHAPIVHKEASQELHTVPIRDAFLPARLGGIEGLEEAYRPVGAPFVELLIEEASDQYWSNQARRREADVDLHDWSAFLSAVGAHAGPYLMTPAMQKLFHAHAETCAYEFIQILKQQLPGSENRAFSWEENPIQTTALDSYTAKLLHQSKSRPEVVTQGLSRLWPDIRDAKTEVSYNLGARRSVTRKTLPLNLAQTQVDGVPLQVRTRDGRDMRAEDCFLPTAENLMIAAGVVPLVNTQLYGENTEFLRRIGVEGAISATSVIHLIEKVFNDERLFRSWETFGPYLELAVRHVHRSKQDAIRLRASRIFLDTEEEELVDFRTWMERSSNESCPEPLKSRLVTVFGESEVLSPHELMIQFQQVGAPGNWNQDLNSWFLRAAQIFHRGEGEEMVRQFTAFVHEQGLSISGELFKTTDDLPPIWNRRPVPESVVGIILPPERRDEALAVEDVARKLGWPVASDLELKAQVNGTAEIDAKTWRLLGLTIREVVRMFTQSNHGEAQRIQDMPFCRGGESLQTGLLVAKSVHLKLPGNESRLVVAHWRSNDCFQIGLGHRDLISAVADLIDCECGVTVAPFMRMISEKMEPHALEADVLLEVDAEPLPSGGSGGNPKSKGDGLSAEDILLGDEGDTDGESPKVSDLPKGGTDDSDGVRKRLCSFVISGAAKKKDPNKAEAGKQQQKKNEETERAGAQLLERYFAERGLQCRSVEDDNVGYDFEVEIGSQILCIELKTSRDKWRGWEHSLSPNEFKTALAKGEDYFLCVIDRIFEEVSREIYFIQNPAGKITDYLFDAPWKSVASKMDDWITRLKATENVLTS